MNLDVVVGQGDSWQSCQSRAGESEVGGERSGALQLKGVGPCQRGQEEEGQGAGLLGQKEPKAIPGADAHSLGQLFKPCMVPKHAQHGCSLASVVAGVLQLDQGCSVEEA